MKNDAKISFSRIFVLVLLGTIACTHIAANHGVTENTRTAYHHTGDQDGFDPNALPAPAAGFPGTRRVNAKDCKDMIYQTSRDGINYVREYGGVYNAAIVDKQLRLYKLSYGHLQPVDNTALDSYTIAKLKYGLTSCNGFYIRSGAQVLTSVTLPPPQV